MNASRTTTLFSFALALVFAAATAHAQEADRKGQPSQAEIRSALDEAAAQWDKTCHYDHVDAHGYCAIHKKVVDKRRCGGEYEKVTIKRETKLAKAAIAAMEKALATYNTAPQEVRSGLEANAAAVQLRLADSFAEHLLGCPFPTRLSFDEKTPAKAKASSKRYKRWAEHAQATLKKAGAGYRAAMDLGAAGPVANDAKARVAAIFLASAEVLEHAYIPEDIRAPPDDDSKVMMFCDQFIQQAEPLRDIAEAASKP